MGIGRSVLTPAEAKRALYVDFEGNEDRDPTLLGVLAEKEGPEFWIVEEAFAGCADKQKARAFPASLSDLAVELVERAEREDRFIVSWSEHDYHMIHGALPGDRHRARLDRVYRNAIFTAVRWREARRPELDPADNALETYARILAWPMPDEVGRGTVGPALTRIRTRLQERNGRWMELTKGMRRAWRDVIKHNRHDLQRMQAVVERSARELSLWLGRDFDRAA